MRRAAEASNVSVNEVKGHTGLLDLSTNGEKHMQKVKSILYFVLHYPYLTCKKIYIFSSVG